MQIEKGGNSYGFCPAKATWDRQLSATFNELCLICEFKQFPKAGCIDDQSESLIETLFWFQPTYENMKFVQKAGMILGDASSNDNQNLAKVKKAHGSKRR